MAIPIRGRRWTVRIGLEVTDSSALWAAARAGLGDAEAEDVIGPAAAPDLGACLQLLVTPDALPGARVVHSDAVAEAG